MISDLGSRNRVAMYTTFFRFFDLRNNPFNVNPDPEYLYLNQRTQALLDEMASAIQARQGLIVLSGEAGTGKTTLVNQLKQWLKEQQTATAFIFNPHLGVDELFELMIADFGIVTTQPRKGSSLGNINRWLQQQYRLGRNAVLFLDEAQGLPPHVLDQIRMLLNTEMPKEKILQIVLSGQPELEEKLRRPEMRQIRQRISLRCHTRPVTQQEAHAYIEKRVQVAGGNGQNIFAPEAIEAIHLYARGIPRVMNMLCEHAMMRAYQYQAETVLPYMVEEAANQLQFDDIKPVRTWPDPDGSPRGRASVRARRCIVRAGTNGSSARGKTPGGGRRNFKRLQERESHVARDNCGRRSRSGTPTGCCGRIPERQKEIRGDIGFEIRTQRLRPEN